MPTPMGSRRMLRIGIAAAMLGGILAFLEDQVFNWSLEALYPIGVFLRAAVSALTKTLFTGGLFLAIGSLLVRHFEDLQAEFRQAAQSRDPGRGHG